MDQRAGSQLSDPALSFLMIDMTRPPIVLAATTSLDCFRTTTWGGKMVSSRRFCEGERALGAQNPVRRGRVDFAKRRMFSIPRRAPARSPRLRCKSGLCYTADAILHSRPIFMSVDAATVRRIAHLARI